MPWVIVWSSKELEKLQKLNKHMRMHAQYPIRKDFEVEEAAFLPCKWITIANVSSTSAIGIAQQPSNAKFVKCWRSVKKGGPLWLPWILRSSPCVVVCSPAISICLFQFNEQEISEKSQIRHNISGMTLGLFAYIRTLSCFDNQKDRLTIQKLRLHIACVNQLVIRSALDYTFVLLQLGIEQLYKNFTVNPPPKSTQTSPRFRLLRQKQSSLHISQHKDRY